MLQTEDAEINAIKYGPYDNGHVIIGLSNGMLLAFSAIDLTKLFQSTIFDCPIQGVCFDPTHLLIVSSVNGEIAIVSLIENKVKYLYVDLGKKQFCTVQMQVKKGASQATDY